jgi:hypothetical protein
MSSPRWTQRGAVVDLVLLTVAAALLLLPLPAIMGASTDDLLRLALLAFLVVPPTGLLMWAQKRGGPAPRGEAVQAPRR